MYEYPTPYGRALTQSEMEQAAPYFASYLLTKGWTMEAICGALGNWESECNLCTNNPQSDKANFPNSDRSRAGGFGMPQWTPCGDKILWYCEQQGIIATQADDSPAASFELQMEYHEFECTQGKQGTGAMTWIPFNGHSYTWEEYKRSTEDPGTLATVYYWQYERSSADSPTTRPNQARAWYEFLTGIDLPDVGEVTRGNMTLLQLMLYSKRRWKRVVVR